MISVVVFTPQIVSLVRTDQSSAIVLFEIPQTGINPEFFEVSYYLADGTTTFDQVINCSKTLIRYFDKNI